MNEIKYHKTLESSHKIAHHEWLDRAMSGGVKIPENISNLVWELMLRYPDSKSALDDFHDDIYTIALEIAQLALTNMKTKQVTALFRDQVMDSIIKFIGSDIKHDSNTLTYSNIISDAITDASLSQLQRVIRSRQMENQAQELRNAKRIQRTLLPKSIPELPGFEFAGRLVPAEEVGGDYWSVKHHASTGIVTVKLADISGHGLAAATLVSAVKFISGGYYQGATSASMVMEKTNGVLTRETPHEILISMVYGWLNPKTADLTLVNAGLEPVFICGKNTCTDIFPTGPVMGFDEFAGYSEHKVQLKKEDVVFFGSDGITEAGLDDIFGIDRLKDLVVSNANRSANEIVDIVVETTLEYGKIQRDDISTLVIKVTE